MSNVFANLPAPVADGVGAAVDVSGMGRERTITVQDAFRGVVNIQFSNEGAAGPWATVLTFAAGGKKTIEIAARFMRVERKAVPVVDPGLPNVDVASNDNGGAFVDLPGPAGDGVGATINVSTLGTFNTVTCLGDFDGTVIIEISEDGTDWSECMTFNRPGWQSKEFVAQFMRAKRKNTSSSPGVPNIDVGAINDATAGGGAAAGAIDGLETTFNTVATVDIEPGSARDSTNTADIVVGGTLTADIAVSGVNGLDTGVEAADTWYALYVIGDTTDVNPTASLLSASFSAPTLPVGYDMFRRVGAVYNLSTSDFRNFYQQGNGRTRTIQWLVPHNPAESVVDAFTGSNAVQLTDCSDWIPPSSGVGVFQVALTVQATSHSIILWAASALNLPEFRLRPGIVNAGGTFFAPFTMGVDAAQQIEWQVAAAANITSILVRGYHDDL